MPLRYDPSAALALFPDAAPAKLAGRLNAARDEVLADVDLWRSGGSVPPAKQPLDAGFIPLPADLLAGHNEDPRGSLLGRIIEAAAFLRDRVDRLVVLGIGGSYMGARALFEALCDPYHNELPRDRRPGPRLYFEGNNVDGDAMQSLLSLLGSGDKARGDDRWGIVVISKSGGTLETAAAFRLFLDAIERFYDGSPEARELVVPVTGETGSKLRKLAEAKRFPRTFPVPEGVGGRFSVLSAVGLLPAACLGIDVVSLLRGAADMTERFRTAKVGENPVLDYVGVCHALEERHGMDVRLLTTWGKKLEAAGLWYDQLLSESLGKQERGALPLTVVNTRDLHSRGQQHQEGKRDKLVTNVIVERPSKPPLAIPKLPGDPDGLDKYAGKTIADVLRAAIAGTNQAYAEDRRPTTDLLLPELTAYEMGELFQMLMLATVVEGRLIGINPYGQPGVEAYKKNMTAILSR
ncbi:MAG TPA: glucose-6-phosphate isomerase [Planctomycetaceae bacterium]